MQAIKSAAEHKTNIAHTPMPAPIVLASQTAPPKEEKKDEKKK